jgi:hypothetical protein
MAIVAAGRGELRGCVVSLEVQCPNCRARYKVGSKSTRTEFSCVKCQTVIPIPRPATEAVAAPSRPEPAPTVSPAPADPAVVTPPAEPVDEYALAIPEPIFTDVAVAEETVGTRLKKRNA